jgi:hypothetical protein
MTIIESTNNSYTIGDVVMVSTGANGFVDTLTGDPADPSVITLKVGVPGVPSTLTTYTYGVGSVIVRTGIGQYYADIDTTLFQVGNYTYEWIGTGGVQAIDDNWFSVTAPAL